MHTVIDGYRRAAGRRAGLRLLLQLLFTLALGSGLPAPAQTGPNVGLPLRNLLVEVRQGEEEEGSQRRQGASGAVVISGGQFLQRLGRCFGAQRAGSLHPAW